MKEQLKKITEALGLLNSMAACGEDHSSTSRAAVAAAYTAIKELGDLGSGDDIALLS